MHFLFKAGSQLSRTALLLLLSIFLLITFALWSVQPRLPSSTEAKDATAFSLAAAQTQLKQITQERHPAGSPGHARVRDYLMAELKAIGLEPQIQSTFAVFEKGKSSGQVQNIVVRLPGKSAQTTATAAQDKKALLLMAHYDATPYSYGAGDDGVSVISILQALRVLKQQSPLQNDVIAVFSDAEEVGLLGASGFAADHPWMKDVGMLLNFDNRGNDGPVLMFETSVGNGKLVAGLAQAVGQPISNSMMYEVYKALPNDTDFTVFRKQGIPGLNFALIQNLSSYHTRYDRSDLINPASQQQQGEMVLQLARHFGNQDLNQLKGDDSIYFSFPLVGLIHYPAAYALPLAALISALVMLSFWIAAKREPVRMLRTAAAVLLFLLVIVALGFVSQRAWNLLLQLYPAYLTLIDPDTSHFYLSGILLVSTLIFVALYQFFSRWLSVTEMRFGAALVWLILLVFTSLRFPGASFLFAWPLFFVALSWLVLDVKAIAYESVAYGWTLMAGFAFALILFAPLVLLFNIALGFHSLGVPVILFALLLGIALPLLMWLFQQIRMPVFLLTSAGLMAYAAYATAAFHQSYPIAPQLIYAAVPQTSQYYWLTPQKHLNRELLSQFSAKAEQKLVPDVFGRSSPRSEWKYWTEVAPATALAAPKMTIMSDEIVGEQREIVVHIQSPEHAISTRMGLEGVTVLKASLQDKVMIDKATEKWNFNISVMPEAGVNLRFSIDKNAKLADAKLRAMDAFYEPPASVGGIGGVGGLNLPSAKSVDFLALAVSTLDIPAMPAK
nr:M28 family peptidase [uncultured Undibacterium sp.]